ncbi:MAG: STAS domain-containing protein [Desulfobulbaceae bacterium]|nr:STAS domain-containing protein [Desulfobulbaceae bacterium]HIJ80031.1 STAS domain-containing protein [Deltaproteobacteria bacterium]
MEIINDLTMQQVAGLRERFLEQITVDKEIVIDLKELQDCDVAGVQFLVSCLKTVKDAGKMFRLENVPDRFIEIINDLGLDLNLFSMG